ncbi:MULTISPECIES: hypothetical protein [Cupriavidus]
MSSTKHTFKLAVSLGLVALIFGSAYGLLGQPAAAELPMAATGPHADGILSLLMQILGPIAAIPALIGIWSQRFPLVGGLVLACPAIAILLLHRFVIG